MDNSIIQEILLAVIAVTGVGSVAVALNKTDYRPQEECSLCSGKSILSLYKNVNGMGVLLGWHEDMIGATSSNTSTGMRKYIGFTGYTTTPALEDMEWTDWMLENYNSFIVYLIIMIMVILCCYIIVGSLTIQRAVGGMFIFAVLAFLPPVAINASVGVINWTCDTIYGNKFVYWALVQHQSYLQDLYAVKSGSAEDYKDFVLGVQVGYAGADKGENGEAAEQTNNNYAPVRLKWISPKKDNYMASQLVHEFDDAFGMKLYDDIKVRFTADGYVQVSQNGKTYQLIDVVAPDGTVIINEKVANDKEKGIK